jgi:hypothetical protein
MPLERPVPPSEDILGEYPDGCYVVVTMPTYTEPTREHTGYENTDSPIKVELVGADKADEILVKAAKIRLGPKQAEKLRRQFDSHWTQFSLSNRGPAVYNGDSEVATGTMGM